MPAAQEPEPETYCPLCGAPTAYEPYRWGLMRFHVVNGGLQFLCPENQPAIVKETAS